MKKSKTYTERQIINVIKVILADADDSRSLAQNLQATFGVCSTSQGASHDAYIKEDTAELFAYCLLKKKYNFRNGKRDWSK